MAKVKNEFLPLSVLGNFPKEWEETTLSDVCHLVTDGTHDSPKPVVDGGYPLVTGKAIKDRQIDFSVTYNISDDDHQKVIDRSKPERNDILFANIGNSIGDLVRIQTDRSFSIKNVALFKPDQSKIHPRFLEYFLLSPQVQDFIKGSTRGSAQPFIGLGSLRGFPISLPSFEEQKNIGTLIGSLDDRITLLRETNSTLEAITHSLFKSWFVDFDPVRAKQEGRQPEGIDEATAALFPDGFEESELGLVPRGWRACTMEDVSVVRIGKTPPRKESHWFSENPKDVRWVSIRDMGTSGAFISSTSEYLTAESIQRFNVRQVPNNTVLLSFKMTIGRVAIIDGEMTTNEAIAHFKLEEQSQLTSEYIYLHLKQFDYTRLSSTSSIADAVNSKTVKAIPILVPNAAIALAFQDAISPIFEKIKLIQHQAQTLATLRDTLLPRLISGQLRLPEVDSLLEESAL